MSVSRIYQPVPLQESALLELDKKASHHLMHVLRAKVNDKIKIFNGSDYEYDAIITRISKSGVEVSILEAQSPCTESTLRIILGQAIPRSEKMDFIIQKSVELGVTQITPLITARTQIRLDQDKAAKRLRHWEAIAVSAAEQSGRLQVPVITMPMRLDAWLSEVKADVSLILSPYTHYSPGVIPSEARDLVPARDDTWGVTKNHRIALLVGPEGGFSRDEVEAAIQHGWIPFTLGPRILRTDTAGLAAISILQYGYGDMRSTERQTG